MVEAIPNDDLRSRYITGITGRPIEEHEHEVLNAVIWDLEQLRSIVDSLPFPVAFFFLFGKDSLVPRSL
jgi:hypothetical protein